MKALRLAGKIPLTPANVDHELRTISRHSPEHVQQAKKHNVIANLLQYELEVYKAYATFNHQVVFDPNMKRVSHNSMISFPASL